MNIQYFLKTLGLAACCAGAALVSCSDDGRYEDGMSERQPVVFTTAVDGAATPVWKGGEQLGVAIDGAVSRFTANADGSLTPEQPLFWEGREPRQIEAWTLSGADCVRPTGWSVAQDQSADCMEGDFLYAPLKAVMPTDKVKQLDFYHQLALVELRITTSQQPAEVRVGNGEFCLSGMWSLAQGAHFGTWTLDAGGAKGGIAPQKVQTTAEGVHVYRALVIPQQIAKGTKLIFVTRTQDGQRLCYTTDADLRLEAGKVLVFNFKIDSQTPDIPESDMTIGNGQIGAWGSQGSCDDTIIVNGL